MAEIESYPDPNKRKFEDDGTEEAEEAAGKRVKGSGVFADLDDDDDDDFGSIIEDNLARLNGAPQTVSHSQSFSFGGAAASMTTPRLPSAYTEAGPLPHTGTGKFDNEGPDEVEGPAVLCHCGLACNKLEAKTEKNAGRQFFRCPKPRDEGQCHFFQWEDEPPRGGTGGTPLGGIPPMQRPPGGRAPTGACFKCGQEGHWSRDCVQSGSGFSGSAGGGAAYGDGSGGYGSGGGGVGGSKPAGGGAERDRSNDTCFKCGQSGHWSSSCPTSKGSGAHGGGAGYGIGGGGGYDGGGGNYGGSGGYGGRGDGGGGGGAGGACYKCGEPGHFSRDCSKGGGGSYRAY